MSSLSSLYRDLRRYQDLLSDIQCFSMTISQAFEALEPAVSKIGSCYEIDEVTADNGEITSCRDRLANHKDYIIKTAVPSIERKISDIKREIEELEAEEEAKMMVANEKISGN